MKLRAELAGLAGVGVELVGVEEGELGGGLVDAREVELGERGAQGLPDRHGCMLCVKMHNHAYGVVEPLVEA